MSEKRSDIRKLPGSFLRVETGPIQFGDDCPGVFIRGDNAGHYAKLLGSCLNGNILSPIAKVQLQSFAHMLMLPIAEVDNPPPVRNNIVAAEYFPLGEQVINESIEQREGEKE